MCTTENNEWEKFNILTIPFLIPIHSFSEIKENESKKL